MQDEKRMIFLPTDNAGLSAKRQLDGEWDHRLPDYGRKIGYWIDTDYIENEKIS